MSAINPYQDIETRRQYKNLTHTQRKNISELKEGVVVNSLIKDKELSLEKNPEIMPSIGDMYDSLVIPEKTTKPETYEKTDNNTKDKPKPLHRSLTPLLVSTVGLFGLLAAAMYGLRLAADFKTKLPPWQTLQEVTKHINVNDEPHLAMLLMIRDPNFRNIMGALGVFVLSAFGFVGKNYIDGVKEIWVRKKQADVQKDLQEKLIEVETKSFSGKMQIVRNMLTEKARELDTVLHKNNVGNENTTFKKFISFKNSNETEKSGSAQNNSALNLEKERRNNLFAAAGVGLSTAAIGILGWLAFHNLRQAAKICKDSAAVTLEQFAQKIEQAEKPSAELLENLKNTILSLNLKSNEIKNFFRNAKNMPQDGFIAMNGKNYKSYEDYVTREMEKLTDQGAEAIAGKPSSKPVLLSFTGELCSHLYNMIVNPESPLLKMVFGGMAAVSAIGYSGAKTVEAVKESEVIKENAKIELDLQKRLVSVELKNFETKKRSVIEPLVDEFRVQAMHGKDKNELKTRAENILYEIKNGPPFVYS